MIDNYRLYIDSKKRGVLILRIICKAIILRCWYIMRIHVFGDVWGRSKGKYTVKTVSLTPIVTIIP